MHSQSFTRLFVVLMVVGLLMSVNTPQSAFCGRLAYTVQDNAAHYRNDANMHNLAYEHCQQEFNAIDWAWG
jgi:putative hemolysin